MTAALVTPPAALAVSLAAARVAARQDGPDADADLQQAVRTYTDEAEHETGRAFIEQTWRVTLNEFPLAIRLPNPPLISIVHVKFYDTAGQLQTLDPQDYMVDNVSEPGEVIPAPGKSWPATAVRKNAVEVQYTVGYGADDTTVPDGVKGFILRRIGAHYGQISESLAASAPRLLDRYRVFL